MKKLRWIAILMVVAIVGVTGFQLYWLKQNYAREKRTLGIKTDMWFRETVMRLQAAKLKLDGANWKTDSGRDGMRVLVGGHPGQHLRVRIPDEKEEIISTVNIIRDKLSDSMRKGGKGEMIIMNKTSVNVNGDTVHYTERLPAPPGGKDYIFDLLYGVDSLQDSLRLDEISTAYQASLKKQKLNIPFTVVRLDSAGENDEPSMNRVRVGFAHPVIFQLKLGNSFPYLLRQLRMPILFSILLLGITLLSFILLYRNVLKQQRLAALKNEFISNITHELKTPIATVGVAIEALKNFNAIHDPERTKEYLDISSNELQRLSLLVDKVLKLSMFEKKEMDLRFENVDLEELVTEVVNSLKLQLEKFHARVTVSKEGDSRLRADRLHLLSVVFNLLDNALKYSSENPVIHVGISGNDQAVGLTVSDNGMGIAPEYRDRIFEKFFRIPHGDTHNAKGYGLGLSYAALVIQQHQGTIKVESEPGKGTVFTIMIPKTGTA